MESTVPVGTGNACRSRIAESRAKQRAPGGWRIESAGLEAHGKKPRAFAVMAEAGVDISQQESTRVTSGMLGGADYLVTVCGHADAYCPVLPAGTRKAHWRIRAGRAATRKTLCKCFAPPETLSSIGCAS